MFYRKNLKQIFIFYMLATMSPSAAVGAGRGSGLVPAKYLISLTRHDAIDIIR